MLERCQKVAEEIARTFRRSHGADLWPRVTADGIVISVEFASSSGARTCPGCFHEIEGDVVGTSLDHDSGPVAGGVVLIALCETCRPRFGAAFNEAMP